jgi:hypothetical protein
MATLAKINGVAAASIAKVNGVAKADIAKVSGVDWPSGTWTPADLTNLYTWHDASDSSTITLSGAQVIEWADKSGNGISATTGAGPLGPTVAAADQNGLDALAFSGSQFLRNGTAWSGVGLSDFSVAVLARYTGIINTTQRGVCAIGTFNSNGYFYATVRSDVSNNVVVFTSSNSASSDPCARTPQDLYSSNDILSVIAHRTASEMGAIINGSEGAGATQPTLQSNFVNGYFFVGGYYDTAYLWIGKIYEIITTKAAMTSAEKTNLLAYWTTKWGL